MPMSLGWHMMTRLQLELPGVPIIPVTEILLQEDGFAILLEDGSNILLEA